MRSGDLYRCYILCVVVLTLIVSGIEQDLVTAVSVVFSGDEQPRSGAGRGGRKLGDRCVTEPSG